MSDSGLTLVTGATGFVGCHLVRKLLQRGERVRILARRQSRLQVLQGLQIERVTGDLTDRESIRQALVGCRFVYHVAADYRLWALDPSVLYQANVEGTRNVLEAARAARVERIVYTSTVGAVGMRMIRGAIGQAAVCSAV